MYGDIKFIFYCFGQFKGKRFIGNWFWRHAVVNPYHVFIFNSLQENAAKIINMYPAYNLFSVCKNSRNAKLNWVYKFLQSATFIAQYNSCSDFHQPFAQLHNRIYTFFPLLTSVS